MSDADVQQAITGELVLQYGLNTGTMHSAYSDMGGMCTESEVSRYLCGVAGLPRLQRDLIAHTVNEQLNDLYVRVDMTRAPYSSTGIAVAGGYAVGEFDGESLMEHRRSPHCNVPSTSDAEAARVASVYASGLLDRPVTGYLGTLPRTTREYFDVMDAGCTLITEDTLITKSFAHFPKRVMPRQETFCNQTIRLDRTLIIPDTHQDPRFRDSPIVTGPPFIRFYAGHPIQGPGGSRIGALCILDDRPRNLNTDDEHKLRTLASLVQLDIWNSATQNGSTKLRHPLTSSDRHIPDRGEPG